MTDAAWAGRVEETLRAYLERVVDHPEDPKTVTALRARLRGLVAEADQAAMGDARRTLGR